MPNLPEILPLHYVQGQDDSLSWITKKGVAKTTPFCLELVIRKITKVCHSEHSEESVVVLVNADSSSLRSSE